LDKATPEPLRHSVQVREKRTAVWTLKDPNGREAGCSFPGRNRVGVDVEGRRLAQEAYQCVTAHDIAAIDAKRLAERCHKQVGGAGAADLFSAAARCSKSTDAMRIIDDEECVLGKCGIKPVDKRANAFEWGMIAAHAEDTVCDDDGARA